HAGGAALRRPVRGLEDSELAEWVGVAQARRVEAGEVIAEQGEEPPGLQLLLEGRAQALILARGRSEPVGHHTAPTWMGAIAVLTGGTLGVRMQAETDCRLATVSPEDFKRLAFAQPEIHQRVMRQVAPVMSRVTEREQNSERLTSLGTMAAGLAHELNNPAAAARRAAAQLTEALGAIDSALASFVEAGVEREDAARLVALQRQALSQAASATALDALDAADAEDELLEQIQALGVGEPWRLAEPLAAAGADRQWLERVAQLAGPATEAALRWVAASLTAGRLSAELCESTERMSSLVGAVKSYAYMDRGALVEVDLHEGLETTLTVLSYKLKHTSIALVREYDRTLPKLTVRGSELNQVWTNLLDNAIDALGEQGQITIATRSDGDCAVVEIADDGPGIPEELAARIFEPFFTTKDVGQGTGLGLATARRIVVERHDGSLTLDSRPGRTVFRVRVPFTQKT
ncbi:MAG TPA: ATP-binding protein, partial [Solirubrobacteraceae bacterium]|nr:ATP-binding protein [Solirubrobacteraceae bacterium]